MTFFDFYEAMARDVNVQQIMTPEHEFKRFGEEQPRREVLELLEDRIFDQTPIYDARGAIRWYVEKEALQKSESRGIKEHLRPLQSEKMVSAGTSVVSLFQELVAHKFLYVLEKNKIVGLATYSDLDRRPVRALLFSLLSELESRLIEQMKEKNPDSEYWLGLLDTRSRGRVQGWYNNRVHDDLRLEKVECFSLGHVVQAIRKDGLLSELHLSVSDAQIDRLVDMRDKVSHPGLDLIASFGDLKATIADKESVIAVLRKLA